MALSVDREVTIIHIMKLSNCLNLLVAIFGVLCASIGAQAGVIKAGDSVQISLRGVPAAEQAKINGQYRVRDSGNIRIPIINVNVRVAGKKPEDVERSIEDAFKKAEIYNSPTVSLQVVPGGGGDVFQKVVIVGGEVKRPGRVQFREDMTLMEALEQAGGRATVASKYLYLTRKNNKTGKLMRHKRLYKDPKAKAMKVFPNDLLNIPIRGPIIDNG